MTLHEYFEKHLTNNGMFPKDATVVMDAVKTNAEDNGTKDVKWSDPVGSDAPLGGYSPQLIAALTMTVNYEALKWIDANCPKAWYRAMFERHPPK